MMKEKEKPKKDKPFGDKIVDLYDKFIEELDAYEKDPYRNHNNFWERDESFEAFIHWLKFHYIS